ncbi:MAG: nitroreductase [Rubellimicrobium sp.]|nr:nitroreductase [Rubellimicrobium sp.]
MPHPVPEALDFLLARKSRPARTLTLPVPSPEQIVTLLTAAARVPDHGKLVPWRFVVLGRAALDRLAALVAGRGAQIGTEPEKIAKAVAQYRDSPLAVAVILSPRDTGRIPLLEQTLSAGAVCMNLCAAATAQGWGANWLTGWQASDRTFLHDGLGLEAHESLAGVIHIGSSTAETADRPRPDLDRITLWPEA